jgi:type II secretory pathway pseudopilin PulG
MRQRWLPSLSKRSRLGSRGDTIVEVLLAIAIVSSVLGGAFVSASRSLRGTQISQERGEALKLVEGQLELVKAALYDETKDDAIFAAVGDFCVNETSLTPIAGGCNQGVGGRYRLTVRRTGNTFNASARWTKIGSSTPEQVNITYRAHPS